MNASGYWVERKRLMRFSDGVVGMSYRGSFCWRICDAGFFFNSMKTSWVIVTLASLWAAAVAAQDTRWTVTEKGPHQKVWR